MEELTSSVVVQQENILRRHMKKHDPREKILAEHRLWMSEQDREFPLPMTPYKVGVYIRYYNQTNHDNYIEYHKARYLEDINLCPRWTLVDFYIDSGSRAPKMENAPEWCRLLTDCFNGKVDLIVTQNVSFVSRDADELSLVSRLLAGQCHPVSIYFISEDIFTTASYFRNDLFEMLDWKALPMDELDDKMEYTPRLNGDSIKIPNANGKEPDEC